ncbi:MAG: FAD binding domain-containing protein [Pseudomonadota bacterium]
MRLTKFEYRSPTTLGEALALLQEHGAAAAVLAGGTDLVPRLRNRLVKADLIVSLKNIPGLDEATVRGVNLELGARASLHRVMTQPEVRTFLPGLAQALASVGAPTIQHETGTIGGNLLLNTRCLQYNQSDWWRSGREPCLKNGGQVCHVLAESKECSASCQSDGAVMLAALSALATLKSALGERTIPLGELFSGRGEAPFTLLPGELLTGLRIMLPPPGTGTSYQKLRWRSAIDFPLVSAGAVVVMSRDKIDRVRLALGAAGPAPLVVGGLDGLLRGRKPTEELLEEAAATAQKQAEGVMVENAGAPAEYRRQMAGVVARRALTQAVERAAV